MEAARDPEEFDSIEFEQRLTGLKDTQDSVQTMSAWCLKSRANHKKIVSSWLNVLKQVKVEHRLTLFHLANDVIQHSKRKNYEFVDSWGTTLQKATTMVRDEKVKTRIIRIFNIWDERGVYNEEFLTDLHNLISINPINQKQQQAESDDEQQQTNLISETIRSCVRNEKETDKSFKILLKTPLCDTENIHSLKDRKHVEDVKRDIDDHMHKLEHYIRTLNTEIKARTILISLLEQTDAFYHNQRGEVKVVANAYRNFGNRIKTMKRKLDDLCAKLPSPIPSPDINAPSPEPDNDFDIMELSQNFLNKTNNGFLGFADNGNLPFNINDFKTESPKTDAQPIQVIGSSSLSKDLNEFNIDELFKSIMQDGYSSNLPQPVPPVSNDYALPQLYNDGLRYTSPQQNISYRPPLPQPGYRPPMPQNNPYNPSQVRPPPNSRYGAPPNQNFNPSFNSTMSNYSHPPRPRYPLNPSNFHNHMPLAPPPVPPAFDGNLSDEYNPESWDLDMSWNNSQSDSFNQTIETPVSPPHFEREGRSETVVEYIEHGHGSDSLNPTNDVDHRQLRHPTEPTLISPDKVRSADVDHRNLISLTGSPPARKTEGEASATSSMFWKADMDFRKIMQITAGLAKDGFSSLDSDYRLSSNLQGLIVKQKQLSSTDEPNSAIQSHSKDSLITDNNKTGESSKSLPIQSISHAPRSTQTKTTSRGGHFRKNQNGNDNVESVDMEMSDEDFEDFPDFSDPFEDDESGKKIDENSNKDSELKKISNEIHNEQSNDSTQEESMGKQSDGDSITSHNQTETKCPSKFKPINIFNAPPPAFARPPLGPPSLVNSNLFSQPNRFWGNSPGMNGMNLNQNKVFQSSNRWITPTNFERQRFNRPPPDFPVESHSDKHCNDSESGDDDTRKVDPTSKQMHEKGDQTGENVEDVDDTLLINEGLSNSSEPSSLIKNNFTPRRQNPFSQMPRMPTNDEGNSMLNQAPNKLNSNSRNMCEDIEHHPRSNMFRENAGMLPNLVSDSPNCPQEPLFNVNSNNSNNSNLHSNQPFNNNSFNNNPFNNQMGQFNQMSSGPPSLFSSQNINFNSPMRGRGAIRGDMPPYFRRGRGGMPGMNMNMIRGNFRPNFRGNNGRGKW